MDNSSIGKWYDISMFILIFYVLIQLSLEFVVNFSEQTLHIFSGIDLFICIIFLSDWFFFLFKAENKWRYVKTRVLDLISSIPFAQILRPLRLLRFIRLTRSFRMIRGLRGASPLFKLIFKNPARSALSIYLFFTFVIFSYCSLGLYNFEYGVNDAIHNFGDIIWMSFTTLTTVGYGDMYPVTTGGRIMAGVLVITGMGLFGLLISEVATLLLELVKKNGDQEELI